MASETSISLNNIATLHLNNYPNRPTIVFLHDSWGCIELWRDFPEKLGRLAKCNVLVYDRQGYGKSCSFTETKRTNSYLEKEADFLIELLDSFQIDNAILFGHSDGGSIALIAGGKYPTRIKGIITEGAHIFVENETILGIKEAVELYHTTDLKAKLEKYHGDKTEAMFWAWASTWTSDEFRTWNIEAFLPKIQCNSLIIQGENDEYATLYQVEQIVNQINGRTTKLVLPNVKHTPHKENPEYILTKSFELINQILSV
ncbi:MAG: alpha/beta hydrolase [Tenuifilaceae bacterium]|nr:alpha/beta hydrolase [Tenuifilaceae bacterium]